MNNTGSKLFRESDTRQRVTPTQEHDPAWMSYGPEPEVSRTRPTKRLPQQRTTASFTKSLWCVEG